MERRPVMSRAPLLTADGQPIHVGESYWVLVEWCNAPAEYVACKILSFDHSSRRSVMVEYENAPNQTTIDDYEPGELFAKPPTTTGAETP
jgi:hypothetical protein